MMKGIIGAVALAGVILNTAAAEPQMLKSKEVRPVSMTLEKELSLGERPDGQDPLFRSVRSFRVDSEGHIYVLDSRAPRLLKFDSEGKLLFSVGRKGQGPGELMLPSGIEWGKDGSLLIYDLGNHRVSYFSAETGELLEEKSTARWPRFVRIDDDSQGCFYGRQVLNGPGKRIDVLSKFSPTLDLVREIVRFEEKRTENQIELYSPTLLFRVLEDDQLLVARTVDPALYWYDSNGDRVKAVETAYRRVPMTAADKERAIGAYQGGQPVPPNQTFVVPNHFPPIRDMIVDDRDGIFIRRHEIDGEGRTFYEAFDKDGGPLGKFPLGFPIICVAGDKMYSLERDQDGFDRICRYRFRIIN